MMHPRPMATTIYVSRRGRLPSCESISFVVFADIKDGGVDDDDIESSSDASDDSSAKTLVFAD